MMRPHLQIPLLLHNWQEKSTLCNAWSLNPLAVVLVAIAMCPLSIEHDEAAPSDPSVVVQLARKEYSV